ncbi:MAG: hypothetical protein CMA07_00115 [Euryarchaeota archaeon]|jgi:hypothetical protein|nr:hypothetical protein [Euryarchaeota archaeon]
MREEMIMTKFEKDQFTWDGMYLMYRGKHTESVNMEVASPNCHPSWVGLPKPEFIARFKYGYKPWKAWVNFLVKNATVEQYLALSATEHPVGAMRALGYGGKC